MSDAATRQRLERLAEALDVAADRHEPEALAEADEVLTRSRERLARGPAHVVVALGGGTGTGKSSLSNALAGRALSAVSPVRPTTDRALVWTVGQADPELLDWLRVVDRQVVSPRPDLPAGLVVIDLPDHDSVRTSHRETVDAAVRVVDVLVFVVDPLKYAQRSLFEGYLRPLAHHAEVVLVVLNRADELDPDGERRCTADLRRLLDDTGLEQARILVTSAATGRGVDDLRAVLADEARSRRAVAERVHADVARAADALAEGVDATRPLGPPHAVTEALARAADLSGAVATARATYLDGALAATRPPLTGLIARGSRRATRPLRTPAALRLQARGPTSGTSGTSDTSDTSGGDGGERPDGTAGGQAPSPIRGTEVALRHGLRELADPFADGVPRTWASRVRRIADDLARRLPPQTRDALDVVALHAPRRLWWAVTAFLWTLVELAILVGVGWLLGLFLIAWLQLPDPPTPQLGALPWPTVLVLAGVPLWLIVRGVRSVAVRRGAERHGRRAARRLRAQVEAAAAAGLRPLHDEVVARDRLVELLGGLRPRAGSR